MKTWSKFRDHKIPEIIKSPYLITAQSEGHNGPCDQAQITHFMKGRTGATAQVSWPQLSQYHTIHMSYKSTSKFTSKFSAKAISWTLMQFHTVWTEGIGEKKKEI